MGSSLAIRFNGSQYLSNVVVSTATDNFGIEAWVKPDTTTAGNRFIACNGDTLADGWAIFQKGGSSYSATLGGVTSFGLATAVAGTWTHLALVRDNGTATFYVDGVAGASSISNPIAPVTGFTMGTRPQASAGQSFIGAIDEVRVFRFGAGQFSTNHLLLNVQRITTLPATSLILTNATLNGSANAIGFPTSAWFEWGTTTNYGNVTPAQALGSGSSNTNFSQNINGLGGGVMYHFRAAASNSLGLAFGTNQSFTPPAFSQTASLSGVEEGGAAWGDYDNDGLLDILLAGGNGSSATPLPTRLWRNTGSGFTNILVVTGVRLGSIAWGDYDNDDRLDILLAGSHINSEITSQVLRNTGSGFTNINAGLTAVCSGDFLEIFFYELGSAPASWGDYDTDGRLDILLAGSDISQVWRNTGSGFTNSNAGLPGTFASSGVWGDYDNDGRLDILLTGETAANTFSGISQVWRNTGSGFSNINAALPGMLDPSAAWGDYDNDGRLDLLLTGTTNGNASGAISQIWRNTGVGFTNINAGLPGVFTGSSAWGDYDNDGRLDILLTGTTNGNASGAISQIWRNTGAGFTNINAGLPGVNRGSVAWADYDNDGRLDILLAGTNQTAGLISQVWRNNTPLANTPPTAPTSLTAVAVGTTVTLSWNASSDAQTPPNALTYNLRVGTTPGGVNVFSPMSAANGFRRLPNIGNRQTRLSATFNATVGTPYYWSVQAIDGAFAGSSFAPERSFKLLQWEAPPVMVPVTTPGLLVGDYNGNGVLDESELNLVLSNYFAASPWLYLTNVAGLGGTNVTFALTNSLAGAFSVEYSTNFAGWYFLGPATPRYLFTDTNAPALPQRYYRLRWP